jgi:hypothetical protein
VLVLKLRPALNDDIQLAVMRDRLRMTPLLATSTMGNTHGVHISQVTSWAGSLVRRTLSLLILACCWEAGARGQIRSIKCWS